MKKIIMLSLLSTYIFNLSAQKSEIKRTNHWYFGAGAGLDFSSGSPVADTTGHLFAYEGCSTMSDTAGNLLFYTNGDTVWNKNHQPMPNGFGLLGCGNYTSSSNAGLIVPKPGSNTLFYVFTTDCFANSGVSGFRYSLVDMSLNSGLGDITVKNHLLFAPSLEGCAATKACNGSDFWVTTHQYNTNNFITYKINSSGLDTVPVISSLGYIFVDWDSYLRFSPNGSKLACGSANDSANGKKFSYDQIFDFDNSSGYISNFINLNNNYGDQGYSPLFSPDNSKLYYSTSGNIVYQYDLSAGNDSASISASVNFVANVISNSAFGSLENALDGKIYISSIYGFDSISEIDNPNSYGSACNFRTFSIYLAGKQSELGLPLFTQNYFTDSLVSQDCSQEGISNENSDFDIQILPNPANSQLHLVFIPSDLQAYSIAIYNEIGTCYAKIISESPEVKINTSSYPSGIYLLKVLPSSSKSQLIKKVIINH